MKHGIHSLNCGMQKDPLQSTPARASHLRGLRQALHEIKRSPANKFLPNIVRLLM